MKQLILFSLLMSTSAFAGDCPKLEGEYHCLINPNLYSRLKITQEQTTAEIVTYTFDYLAIQGEAERVPASTSGEPGEFGWYTKCKNNKLLSIPGGTENMLSEIYLDRDQALVRVVNEKVVQRCPNVKNK